MPSPAPEHGFPNEALEALVFECLERFESEGEAALERLCAEHPGHAERLRERIGVLRRAGLCGSSGGDVFPERLGEFRLLECLGAGGMGVVYLAEQTSLGRRVALKLIRPEHLYFPGSRERFRREVEAVARLQHPSIAAVYTSGDERGIPYFAMEYVRGRSLAQVIAACAGADPSTLTGADLARLLASRDGTDTAPPFEGSWMNVVLRIVRDVALAVAHAHERGVLHRDIKPSNVMLTAAGRVALLDFGLALSSGDQKLTRTGTELGSLPYMAPEQVNGDVQRIDARTDVYAMGVLLFELLALRAPYFDPRSTERTRQLVLEGEFPGLGSRVRGLPRDVEVVCRTAMAAEPRERYASALALAADLENVLAHRPIQARRTGAPARAWKWTRRHPAAATALALAVGAPLALAVQQGLANRRLSAANRTVSDLNRELEGALALSRAETRAKETERRASERNFESAIEAVDTLLERVGSQRLTFVPQMENVRRELLEDAARFYHELSLREAGDARLVDREATTRAKLGDVLNRLGRPAEAEVELATAADLLVREASLNAEGQFLLARITGFRAEAKRLGGKPAEALALARDSVAILAQASAREDLEAGRRTSFVRELAIARAQAAELECSLGDLRSGEENHRLALQALRPLAGGAAPDPRAAQACAKSLGFLVAVHSERGEGARASAAAEEAIALLERFQALEPDDTSLTLLLLSALGNLGDLHGEAGHPEKSRPLVERALELGERLVADFPSTTRFRQNLSIVYVQAFFVEMADGKADAARARLEQALALQRRLVRDEPTNAEYIGTICTTLGNLGALDVQEGDVARGLERFEEAAHAVLRALESSPRNPEWLRFHEVGVRNRALVLFDHGRFEEAARVVAELDRHTSARAAGVAAGLCLRGASLALSGEHPAPEQAAALRERALAALDTALERGLADLLPLETAGEIGALVEDPEVALRLAAIRSRAGEKAR